ncbi:DUF4352 domain-containing protein [Phytohabitans sp. ZYX-F-186]|uniref:DUF4352 domain-containing protein n=1 Tax=Phytohabitans maris TaxID=3071409 RepID=A0ABU0Z8N2_9ACTN|nr:DUF4352 domain-containing protein [Phytohabitans sp. ZYX-F-186]MDQ7903415.1 DUF4352 domain-containing protein [Phytohabitans sp. ZYX-F-186]
MNNPRPPPKSYGPASPPGPAPPPHVRGRSTATIQGQFCLVSMSVENIGDSARTLDATSQYAYDAAERKFDADSLASMYASDDNDLFLNEINPGNRVDAVLVFDVPKETSLTKLELHDSPFSGGVTVELS